MKIGNVIKLQSGRRLCQLGLILTVTIATAIRIGFDHRGKLLKEGPQTPERRERHHPRADFSGVATLANGAAQVGQSALDFKKKSAEIKEYLRFKNLRNWDADDLMDFRDELRSLFTTDGGHQVYEMAMLTIIESRPQFFCDNLDMLIAGSDLNENQLISNVLWESGAITKIDKMEGDNKSLMATLLVQGATSCARSSDDILTAWQLTNYIGNKYRATQLLDETVSNTIAEAESSHDAVRELSNILSRDEDWLKPLQREVLMVALAELPNEVVKTSNLQTVLGLDALDKNMADSFVKGLLRDPVNGLKSLDHLTVRDSREYVTRQLVKGWLRDQPMEASQAVSDHLKGDSLSWAAEEIASYLQQHGQTEAAKGWLSAIGNVP